MAGLAGNFEELTVHMSWNDPLGYVNKHVESFERIWTGARPELIVRELDEAFGAELARAARTQGPMRVQDDSPYRRLLGACRSLVTSSYLNLSRAALFPHQERALLEAADRWPIRVLLADEVGLGKTLEAGALVAHMRRTGAAHRIIILAPKSVLANGVMRWRLISALTSGCTSRRVDTSSPQSERFVVSRQAHHPSAPRHRTC